MTYCCVDMDTHLSQICGEGHEDLFACPDVVIVKTDNGFGLPVHDGGSSYIEIRFCPWCGERLEE